MTYIAAADLRERTVKPWAAGIVLTEADASDGYLDLIAAQVTTQVELDLADDFEPPNPDNAETIDIDGSGSYTLYLPRRTRSLTTVSTRDSLGVLTAQASTSYRLKSSLNAAGTAMVEGRKLDTLTVLQGLTTGWWPVGPSTMQLVGKFGWAAVPDDIKRLVAKYVYDLVKAKADATIVQRTTVDAVLTYGPDPELEGIISRYKRTPVLVA